MAALQGIQMTGAFNQRKGKLLLTILGVLSSPFGVWHALVENRFGAYL